MSIVSKETLSETCDVCSDKLSSKVSFKQHKEAIHLGYVNFMCPQCPYRSYFKKCVQIHIKSMHGELVDIVKRIDCKLCRMNEKHQVCKIDKQIKTIDPTIKKDLHVRTVNLSRIIDVIFFAM